MAGIFRRLTRPLRHSLAFAGFLILRGVVAVIPRKAALAVGVCCGRGAFLLCRNARRAAVRRLTEVLGMDRRQAEVTTAAMFVNFAKNVVDLMIFAGRRRRKLPSVVKRVTGFEYIERAMAEGRGVVGITAHFCNWEILGGYVAARLGGIAVLAHPTYDKMFNRLLVNYRRRLGVTTIYRQEPPSVALNWLRVGGFLGVLADQRITDMPSVTVDFLGRPAATPIGPALLARRTGAPLIPIFITRDDDDLYAITVEPPLTKSAARKTEEALAQDTASWSVVVGKWVAARPELWVWVHDRWGDGGG